MASYFLINIFVTIILGFIFVKLNRNLKGRKDGKILLVCIGSSMIIALADAVFSLVEGLDKEYAMYINYITSSIYFFAIVFTAYMWLCFACYYKVRVKQQHDKVTIWLCIAAIPMIFFFFFIATNYWHHLVFSVELDATGAYCYVANVIGHTIHLVISIVYLLLGAVSCLIFYNKAPNDYAKKEYANMILFIIFPIIFTLIQKLVSSFAGEIVPFTTAGIGLAFIFYYGNFFEYQISYDELTGLGNRYVLKRYVQEKISDAFQESNYLVICDIDGLKQINDTHGHVVGDKAIVETSSILRLIAEDHNSIVTRYGGDEFILVASEIEELGVIEMIKLIQDECDKYNNSNPNEKFNLSMKFGYTKILTLDRDFNDIVKRADEMLYQRKKEK